MTKTEQIEKAVEITKEYVRGGGGASPETILERVYQKIAELDRS